MPISTNLYGQNPAPAPQTYAEARKRDATTGPSGSGTSYNGQIGQQPSTSQYGQETTAKNALESLLTTYGLQRNSNPSAWAGEDAQAAGLAYSQGFLQPLLTASQNAKSQQFTEDSWLTNFQEQQYLNQNQTALDWAGNAREDKGLDYAIKSGDAAAAEAKRQYDTTLSQQNSQFATTSTQNQYDLTTQRAAQQAQDMYQRGQISLGQMQNMVDKARQEADARYQGGQLDIAQQQNTIDAYYKQGLITVQQRDAATNELKARNEMTLGTQQNQTAQYAANTERMQTQLQNAVSVEQNKIDAQYKAGLISVEQKNAATSALKEKHDYALGQLAQQTAQQAQQTNQYSASTDRMQVQLSNAVATKQNEIDQAYKTGLITVEQKNAQTAQLKEQHDYALGQLQNSTDLRGQDIQKQLGLAQNSTDLRGQDIQKQIAQMGNTTELRAQDIQKLLGLTQNSTEMRGQDIQSQLGTFSNETDRMRAQNEMGIAQGQLALDQMYKMGQLSTEQYQAETGRLQQQSQQAQWVQQLASQQSQFGQTLAQQQAELQANLIQQRYNTAGRARNPNYAAWNTRFY